MYTAAKSASVQCATSRSVLHGNTFLLYFDKETAPVGEEKKGEEGRRREKKGEEGRGL